jgi:hypothetical protein
MATENLQIPDIQASQNQKEVTANAAHNLLDRALNGRVNVAMSAGVNNMTTTQMRENFVMELTGTPGSAFTLEMADTNKRTMAVVNNTNAQCTVQNPSAGGTGQPVIQVGEAAIFHFDGTNFFDFSALALTVANWTGLTDTPANFTAQAGNLPRVNAAETALEFVQQAAANNVIAATTVNSALATTFENGDIIDGVTLATGDRILIKNQTAGQENGVYIVQATGAPVRVEEFQIAAQIQENPFMVAILEGTVNAGTVWVHTTAGAITVDTTPLTFGTLLGPGTFLALTDAPSSFVGESGTRITPNNAETALVFEGTPYKDPVVAATTAALTLSTDVENADTIDGVTLATGDRVLIKNQAAGAENGIYTVNATGAPTRTDDFDDDKDAVLGAVVAVNEGTANKQTFWQMTNTTAVTVGTTAQTWAQVGGASANRWTEAVLETTDATVTSIVDIALSPADATAVRGFIIGTEVSTANSFAANFFAAGKNNGGTSAELASAVIDKLDASPASAWDFTIDVDDTGDNLRLRVTGEAATTIDWRIQYEVITEDNV